jgi:hypothetical protein
VETGSGESPYDHHRGEVEAMLAVGRPLGSVERMLERAPLDPDERSALWLFAWSLHEHAPIGQPERGPAPVDG